MKKKNANWKGLKFPILTTLILIFLIAGCKDTEIVIAEAPNEIEEPIVNPDPPPEPPITQQPIEMAVYDGSTLNGYDGIDWYPLLTGNVLQARNNFFVSDQTGFPVLYELNNMGAVLSEQNLPFFPSKILRAWSGDVYSCENIPPADAHALGGQYKDYVQIWKNDIALTAHWSLNQWKCTDIIETISGDVFALDDRSVYHGLNNSLAVDYAEHGGLLIYDLVIGQPSTAIYKTDTIYPETWICNYAFNPNARTWQFDGVNRYNANGYKWSEAGGLIEQATTMWSWNAAILEAPVLLSVGTRFESGEVVLYWLECNTGWLYRYIPSVDRMDQAVRLYIGDGLKASGILVKEYVNPYIVGDVVYFSHGGSLNKANLDSGIASVLIGFNISNWRW
jgi:hypothetical protein